MYTITLLNSIFDKENDNVLLCNSKQDLKAYINTITDKVVVNNDCNFDVKNLIETTIYVDVNVGFSLLKLLNYNYCIVQNNDVADDVSYWFVNKSRQDNGYRIALDLKIDWFNTYWYDINDMQGVISRTHLDRFKPYNNEFVYNFGVDSPLFERETIRDLAKRTTKKFKLQSHYDTSSINSEFDKWLNDNVECWKYYYISADKLYKLYLSSNGVIESQESEYNLPAMGIVKKSYQTSSNIVVLAEPVYKTTKTIFFKNNATETKFAWSGVFGSKTGIENFLRNNNNFANVYSIKYSIVAPFEVGEYSNDFYEIDTNGQLVLKNNGDSNKGSIFNGKFNEFKCYITKEIIGELSNENQIFMLKNYQNLGNEIKLSIPQDMYKLKFTASQIDNSCEPKLYNEDYATYRIYFGGNEYELPIAKSSNRPYFIYKEILNPDITKSILIFNPNNTNDPVRLYYDTIFNEYTEKDLTGFISTLDASLWFTSDKLDTFLAENKNNLQIFNNNQNARMAIAQNNAISSSIGGILAMTPASVYRGTFGTMFDVANEGIKQTAESMNYNLNIDNMRNSPQQLQSMNSDAVLISYIDEFGIFIEMQEPIDFEKQSIIDYFKIFGYTYNKINKVKQFVKTRKYYNYLQANIFEIDGHIAEQLKDLIKSTLSKGIRFWHKDNFTGEINFDLNNIERSISNG